MLVCAIVSSNMFNDERVKVLSMLGLGQPKAWSTLRSRGFDCSSFERKIRALGGLTHENKLKKQKKKRKNAGCKHENKTNNNEYKHTRTHKNMHTHTHNTHTHTRTQKHKYPMHARCVRVGVYCVLKMYVCV
jgi:cell wall-associated NlpC family hydrolase